MTPPPPQVPLPYAPARTPTPPPGGGPPSLGPFVTAAVGAGFGGGLLVAVWAGMTLTMFSVLAVLIPGMIVAFTLAGVSMGWMFLLFGRFGRRSRWLLPACLLIGLILLELFGLTYIAGLADQASNPGGGS